VAVVKNGAQVGDQLGSTFKWWLGAGLLWRL
jgi:hypothetical protein